MPEFQGWPKIARLNRDIIITEKIDGTNAAVGITAACCPEPREWHEAKNWQSGETLHEYQPSEVYAQSRTRIITPEKDNFGFARWVEAHADNLRDALGSGLHFGEWWGNRIQRGYGLANGDKRFSLFNVPRFAEEDLLGIDGGVVRIVPILYAGLFHADAVAEALNSLRYGGSYAAPGYMKPEGIVVFHAAAKTMFKVTLEGDEKTKGPVE